MMPVFLAGPKKKALELQTPIIATKAHFSVNPFPELYLHRHHAFLASPSSENRNIQTPPFDKKVWTYAP
jgi:hypothetical protein